MNSPFFNITGLVVENSRGVTRWRCSAIAFYLVSLVACVLGGFHFRSNVEDVFQWLPDQTPDREVYNEFVRLFGTDDFLVVTWPGCVLTDQRLTTFSETLVQQDDEGLIDKAFSGRDLLLQLVKQNRERPSEVIDRFKGIYFGPDGKTSCVIVMLTANGMEHRRTTVQYVQDIAQESIDVTPEDLVLGGYPQVGAYGDEVVRTSLMTYVGPSCIISTVVAWFCLRSSLMVLSILAISGLASGLSIAVVILTGATWGGLSSVIPALAYILTVSGSMHLVNYAQTPGTGRVLFRVFRIGWKPCTLSVLTTAAGMLSLCNSEFAAIREFGLYCAAGVFVSLLCQLILVPVAIDLLAAKQPPPVDPMQRIPFLDRLLDHSAAVVFVFLSVAIVTGAGLVWLDSDLEVERNFSKDSSVMRNIAQLEEHLGPLEQYEVLVRFHNAESVGFPKRVQTIRKIEQQLRASEHVHATLSVAAWLPQEPKGGSLGATAVRSAYREQLIQSQNLISESPYLTMDGDDEVWRVSIRFPFLEAVDVNLVNAEVREVVKNALRGEYSDNEVSVQNTGVVVLYYVAQSELVIDVYRNFAIAFAVICPLMILVLRSFKEGFVAMIPNVCPALIAYGFLGWCDYPIDIGMAMTACVALGIAVDDTTHFLLRIQELQQQSGIKGTAALRVAFRQCSRAMLHTTLITGCGMSAFLFSPLLSMTRFAALLVGMLVIALLCDLVLLPALLKVTGIVSDAVRQDD